MRLPPPARKFSVDHPHSTKFSSCDGPFSFFSWTPLITNPRSFSKPFFFPVHHKAYPTPSTSFLESVPPPETAPKDPRPGFLALPSLPRFLHPRLEAENDFFSPVGHLLSNLSTSFLFPFFLAFAALRRPSLSPYKLRFRFLPGPPLKPVLISEDPQIGISIQGFFLLSALSCRLLSSPFFFSRLSGVESSFSRLFNSFFNLDGLRRVFSEVSFSLLYMSFSSQLPLSSSTQYFIDHSFFFHLPPIPLGSYLPRGNLRFPRVPRLRSFCLTSRVIPS